MKLEAIETETLAAPKAPTIDTALLRLIQDAVMTASREAVTQSTNLAGKMITEAVERVEKRLASIEAPPRMIARLSINGVASDLGGAEISEQTAAVIAEIVRNTHLGLNTMLVGPAGCGKTTMAALAAKAMQVPFGLISWTAGMSETPALFARWDGQKYVEALWSRMYSLPGLFCHDEMDRADANALCKINAGTANGHFYNEVLHEMRMRNPLFGVVATCNTVGRGGDSVYGGANALDGSTLDRFVKVMVDYDAVYEKRICPDKGLYKLLTSARAKLRDLQAQEILSTRSFEQTYLTFHAGKPLQACIDSLTAGWNADLVKQVGLDAENVARIADAKHDASQSDKDASTNALGSTESESVRVQAPPKIAADVKAKIDANEARIAELKRKLAEQAGA